MTSCTILSSNAGIPKGLNLPFGLGIITFLVSLNLYCPATTSSLILVSLVKVVPSIVTLSKDGVLDPGDLESLIYAAFHRSSSNKSENNLSFLKFGSFLFPSHSVSNLLATLESFQDGASAGSLVEYGWDISFPTSSPLPIAGTTEPLPHMKQLVLIVCTALELPPHIGIFLWFTGTLYCCVVLPNEITSHLGIKLSAPSNRSKYTICAEYLVSRHVPQRLILSYIHEGKI